ncbi:thioredoxin family protein [Variovorax sp. OV329]|uniref:thioredoxin family protein n=1 Tax=Variovorax sp. OV329 TaxID=1882825 RepID=UPI0008EE031D|nr:thioredoxin family protein [Variovorax sp. OV329]SFN36789.1 Thiol-disulfide isomerase or thioredoxin [Variovorax sp. OV329]
MSALPNTGAAAAADDNALWVVCLCAEWCGTCRDYRPLLQEVARKHPQMRFAWVDIEDHSDISDEFEVETFPTLLIAGRDGTRFLGPLLPHAETLSRMLSSAQPVQPSSPEVAQLLAAIERSPADFEVR